MARTTDSPWDDEFSQYFAARARLLRATAYLLCGDWHRAEDITQVALTKLYVAWPRLHRRDELDGYARTVVVRTFLAENRRLWRRREQLTHEPPERPAADPEPEHRVLVRSALGSVPPKQRAVLVLRYWNDLSVEQTAAALGCSTGTVKSQAARGLAALRTRLGPHFSLADTWRR
ncbi:SigE family RNA polymerase sigma factor [Prauserella cavernicola]|uniref:SigE family RNA polymerase sigma factor n=1 Tax=Prauserella cavernicola TaxID=2800127 RepID=UPI001E2CB01A|nr:SigE family RNA polymerase sigma factor [Prauserella cavernicola]